MKYVIRIGCEGYYDEERYPVIVPVEQATKMEYLEAVKTLTQFRKLVAPNADCGIQRI